jgi:hypothetical protein
MNPLALTNDSAFPVSESGISRPRRASRILVAIAAPLMAVTSIFAAPTLALAASVKIPYADRVYCSGMGNDLPERDYIEVPAPVIWAYNRHAGVQDTQYVSWIAELLRWNGSTWQTVTFSTWASPYLVSDGEGGTSPIYDPAAQALSKKTLVIPDLGHLYSVRITVYWYAVGNLSETDSSVIPLKFLEDGWLDYNRPYCDYHPDSGVITF